jgi:hypothetical protein
VWVIRADIAGRTGDLVSYTSSEMVDPKGLVLQSVQQFSTGVIVADIDTARHDEINPQADDVGRYVPTDLR